MNYNISKDAMDYDISKIASLSAAQIVAQMMEGDLPPLKELRDMAAKENREFPFSKQQEVQALWKQEDDKVFAAAATLEELEKYLSKFPAGNNVAKAKTKITEINKRIQQRRDDEAFAVACAENTISAFQEYVSEFREGTHVAEADKKIQRIDMLRKIREGINEYTPGEIIEKLSTQDLDDLCQDLGINIQLIRDYRTPSLEYNEIPQSSRDIPAGYTDVFFWGIPSSGKTCALAAILSTMNNDYLMEAPDCGIQFGATYRDSLINIFRNEYSYLPGRNLVDRTQYMPFLFYKEDDTRKRRISFFELSGEVFQYFYEKVNKTQIIEDQNKREAIERSFQTLELLLNSNNQKIHFFFIDYNQENTTDPKGRTQKNYLEAAATYFRDTNDILRKKTDAVYVVVTKSDEIRSKSREERAVKAKTFLDKNFSSFMGVLKKRCKEQHVYFKVKLFSIGTVYFKQICKIDREYSDNIIKELLNRVKPGSGRFRNFANN